MKKFSTIFVVLFLGIFAFSTNAQAQVCEAGVLDIPDDSPGVPACIDVVLPAGGFQNLSVTLSHTWIGDVYLYATPPAACGGPGNIDLFHRPGFTIAGGGFGQNSDAINTMFTFVCDGSGADPEGITADPIPDGTYNPSNGGGDGTGTVTCADLLAAPDCGGTWSICAEDNAGGDLGTLEEACVLLPVELSNFTSVIEDNKATLTWTTLTESNNAGFAVEHSEAGSEWVEVAFVSGNGTTTEAVDYTFEIDNLEFGSHSFRLKQVDFDGTFTYSDQVNASNDLAEGYSLRDIYPNPFNPEARMEIFLAEDQNLSVTLYNVSGEMVKTLYSGELVAQTWHNIQINGSDLPSGQYFVRAQGRDFAQTQAVVLLK